MKREPIDWRSVDTICTGLVGLPFQAGARGPAAFDCWGLVLELRRRLGLPVPPDVASGALSRSQAHAMFHVEWPGWRRGPLSHGGIILAECAAHAGVHLAGRIVHAQATAGVVAWTLGHWSLAFGELDCWEAV
jgi:cell wall-associated NlpC family hydrolase